MQQLKSSPMTLLWKYSSLTFHKAARGNGIDLSTCAEDGELSFSIHPALSISNFFVPMEHLSKIIWTVGQHYL